MALLGAVAWGVAPVFGKLALRDMSPLHGMAIRTVISVPIVIGCILATGGLEPLLSVEPANWVLIGIEGLMAGFAGDLAYYASLKYGTASVTLGILAASPLFTLWIDASVLRIRISHWQTLGTVLVIGGVLLIMFNGPRSPG